MSLVARLAAVDDRLTAASTSAEVGPEVQRHGEGSGKQSTDEVPTVEAPGVTDRISDEGTSRRPQDFSSGVLDGPVARDTAWVCEL